ncbi:hypothetical protein GCM10009554_15820 [Kribbella koreensis]|uniref:Uncharacterized protein n=1 Tax=Kribbella koreensis TaxID=57909 RepID=A0ABP4A6F8_9ACTN
MADEYSVFLGTELAVEEVAGLVQGVLGAGVSVHGNWHVLGELEAGEAQAIDPYGVQVDLVGGGDEARASFERLVGLGMPLLLVEDVTYLVAAYLPDAGTHYFAAGVSMDEPDLPQWRDWVTEVREG